MAIGGKSMAIKDDQSTVAATVRKTTRETLQALANWEGVSLSHYIANILEEAVKSTGQVHTDAVRQVSYNKGSYRIAIPPRICTHLEIEHQSSVAFAPVPGGALIRPVR